MERIGCRAGEQTHQGGLLFLTVLVVGLIGFIPARALPDEPLPAEAYEWHIIKGIVAGQDNDWPTAEAHFRQALAVLQEDREATVGLGMALARQGKNEEALALLEPAKQVWPNDSTLWEELAPLYRLMGQMEKADGAAANATRLLAPIAVYEEKEEKIGLSQPVLSKPGWGRALAALEHDTNAFLVPEDPVLQSLQPLEEKLSDTRLVVAISGGWRARKMEQGEIDLGTLLYQSETQSFKLRAQGMEGSLTYQRQQGQQRFQMPVVYQYAAVDHARYQQSEKVAPTLTLIDSRMRITTLHYQLQFRKFFASPRFPANPDRNGQAQEWAVTRRHPLQKGAITMGYRGKVVNAEGGTNSGDWDGTSHGVLLMREDRLPAEISSHMSAEWDSFRYKHPNSQSPTGKLRSDAIYTASGLLSRWIGGSKGVRATLSIRYEKYHSNIPVYDYKRKVTAFALEREF